MACQLTGSLRATQQVSRQMCFRIWVHPISHCQLQGYYFSIATLLHVLIKEIKQMYAGEVLGSSAEFTIGAPSSKIPNEVDVKTAYRGVAASLREHLIDAFNRTQDYWRFDRV